MKKLISLVLVLCLILSFPGMGVLAAEKGFSDVAEGQWFYEPIMASAGAGLVAGNPDGSYLPHKELSWVETVVFAVRLDQFLKGEKIYSAEDQVGLWYSIYTDYALEMGFIDAVSENPSAAITRGESADIFSRVMWQGDCAIINDLPDDYFSDVPIDHPYNFCILFLANIGIVNGVSEGVFGVDNSLKRSEVATIVARMASLTEKVIIVPDADVDVDVSGHSPLYVEGLDVDTLIRYFAEVCLDTEFGDKESNRYVRKWTQPIWYKVHGIPNDEDIATLEAFTASVNAIPGFPGIYPAENDYQVNLDIHFCNEQDFNSIMGSDFVGSWGGVSFWFSDYRIYSEKIAVRSDIPQSDRNAIIGEEIYNGIGPVQDTTERYDSLIYQWSNTVTEMSVEDELILKLLYDEAMIPGMNYDECAEVIRSLYY